MVVSQSKNAAEAGVAVLDAGGNAIDAAVATALALAAVEPWNSGLGGIGHALVHRAGQARAETVDFGPTAPAALDPSRFKLTGRVAADLFALAGGRGRHQHPRAALVRDPLRGRGLCRDAQALGQAAARRDRRAGDRAGAARPAAGLVHDAEGRELGRRSCASIPKARASTCATGCRRCRRIRARFGYFRLGKLAETLERLAQAGWRDFYEGEIAASIVADVRAMGGVLSAEDLRGCKARVLAGDRSALARRARCSSPARSPRRRPRPSAAADGRRAASAARRTPPGTWRSRAR